MNGYLKVADNFYPDPDLVRGAALRAKYKRLQPPSYGYRSCNGFLPDPDGVRKRIKDAFGFETILLYHEVEGTTCFYHSKGEGEEKESFHVHTDVYQRTDDLDYSMVVYLAPNAPRNSGTAICRHKQTKIWQEPTLEDAKRLGLSRSEVLSLLDTDAEDYPKWDILDSSENIYNRAVLFPAHWCHTGLNYFGNTIENCRLYQIFFLRGFPDVFSKGARL
jgi:hypothetical protein